MRVKLITVLLISIAAASYSATYNLSKATNEVNFIAVGQPSAIKIKGVAKDAGALSGQLKIAEKDLSGIIELKLAGLSTGIDMRDQHMKEKYLEVAKHPAAELTLSQLPIGSKEAPFNGQLKLHGITHGVSGKSSCEVNAGTLTLALEFGLLLKDHLIEIPSYLGIKVANDVKVMASTEGKVE